MIEDEFESDETGDETSLDDPLASVLAGRADASLAADSRAYLRERTRLARLQSDSLVEQNQFEMSHLEWRRFADRVRGAGHALLLLTGLLLPAGIGIAIWSAANDHSLVVESFSVTPALAGEGETGTVVAQHVLDRIVTMQAGTQSLRAAKTYRNNWGVDLKVQIPDTGVSFGEAYRFLVGWLGQQTRITGEVVRDGNGFAVTARAGTGVATTQRGTDLNALLDKVAEQLFGETQPYRYGIYLSSHGREKEAKAVLLALAQSNEPETERAWAYSGLLFVENDTRQAEQYGEAALALNPRLLLAHNNLSSVAWRLGHSELAYRETDTALKLLDQDAASELDQRVLGNMRRVLAEERDTALGDYLNAVRVVREDLTIGPAGGRARSQIFLVRDLSLIHEIGAARRIVIDPLPQGSASAANRQLLLQASARATFDVAAGDWAAGKAEVSQGIKALGEHYASLQLQALLVLVEAELGNVSWARALAAHLPPDCYPCLLAHAQIEALDHRWGAAGALFAEAVREAPSLPAADQEWGALLLREGKCDAAIEKFREANLKGPHFADPLEMWGEALMQENRSDLALAKFEEANASAPNWGRLHLEWGKALVYAGKKEEAKKQFAIATRLDLSATDKLALAKWMPRHD